MLRHATVTSHRVVLGRDDGGLERFLISAGEAQCSRVWVWIGVLCLGGVVRVGWSCRRMPLSGGGFGCLVVGRVRGMWRVWVWRGVSMRCWGRWWSVRSRVGWC